MSCAISSGMPTFFLTKGVPVIDRRARCLVSPTALKESLKNLKPNPDHDYPPGRPLCLRGHTPAMVGGSKTRIRPPRSVRGPRGSNDVKPGAFPRPGILKGCCISPWVIEEEAERAERAVSHKKALSKDPSTFRRQKEEGGLLDYGEQMHLVRNFLNKTHPVRDTLSLCPPKSGYSFRRVEHESNVPDWYDTSLDGIRPRTVGYSPGHVRSLSPTPPLTWGGRASSKGSLEWVEGRGALGAVKGCLGSVSGITMGTTPSMVSKRIHFVPPCPKRIVDVQHQGSPFTTSLSGESPLLSSRRQARPMWGPEPQRQQQQQGHSTTAASALRPFTSSTDHLGRPMSRLALSRSTKHLQPYLFDTLQRRTAYADAIAWRSNTQQRRGAALVAA
ncbi:unnamed protein product, partial [Discosporangium mesarthrocarpum]